MSQLENKSNPNPSFLSANKKLVYWCIAAFVFGFAATIGLFLLFR